MNYKNYWCERGRGTDWQLGCADIWADQPDDVDARWMDSLLNGINIKSIADVGCGTGRLFPVWARHKLTGIAVEWSDVEFPIMAENAHAINITPYKLDITRERTVRKVNLVFATQLLLHIMPKDIFMAMRNLTLMTNKYIVLCNWFDKKSICNDITQDYDDTHNWTHDYYKLFKMLNLKVVRDEWVTFDNGKTNKIWLLEVV